MFPFFHRGSFFDNVTYPVQLPPFRDPINFAPRSFRFSKNSSSVEYLSLGQGGRLNEIRSENDGGNFYRTRFHPLRPATVNFRFQFSSQTNALCCFLAPHPLSLRSNDKVAAVIHPELHFFHVCETLQLSTLRPPPPFAAIPRVTLSFYLTDDDYGTRTGW